MTCETRGARVKHTLVTAIKCTSGDGRYLNSIIIWPASTHRNNWTTYPSPWVAICLCLAKAFVFCMVSSGSCIRILSRRMKTIRRVVYARGNVKSKGHEAIQLLPDWVQGN